MEKYCRAGQAAYDNVAHAHWHPGYQRLQIHTQNTYYLLPFALQQWLHERAPILRHTYTACHVTLELTLLFSRKGMRPRFTPIQNLRNDRF